MNGSNLMSEHQQSGLVVNWPLSVQARANQNAGLIVGDISITRLWPFLSGLELAKI
jgi:hypothetical protein